MLEMTKSACRPQIVPSYAKNASEEIPPFLPITRKLEEKELKKNLVQNSIWPHKTGPRSLIYTSQNILGAFSHCALTRNTKLPDENAARSF